MKNIITKITSRKFLFAVAVFIIAVIGVNDDTLSIISATVTAIAYMFSEAIVDKARAIKRTVSDSANVEKYINTAFTNVEEQKNANE